MWLAPCVHAGERFIWLPVSQCLWRLFATTVASRFSCWMAVTVKSPTTRHELMMAKLESWLLAGAKSPKKQMMKNQLTEIFGIMPREK